MSQTTAKTIAFIHGAFVTKRCWDDWVARFEAAGSRPYYMSFPQFQYNFGNDLSLADQRAGYDADIVPESRPLARGGLSSAARVDFKRRRAPLLMIAAEKDHIMPAALNRRNYRRYSKSPSVTAFKQFPGRAHYSILAGKGWEEVADYALDWALKAPSSPPAEVSAPSWVRPEEMPA